MTIDIPPPERLQVKIAEAAKMLDVHESTFRRMMQNGHFEYTGHGRGLRIIVASIHAYIEANRKTNGTTY